MSVDRLGQNTRVVVFCGGRGSATIIRELLRWPTIDLTLLVNAYDDGMSTGALRNFIPGMLGPSDIRKNLSYLLDLYSDEQYALKSLIEFRLPMDFGRAEMTALQQFVTSGATAGLPPAFAQHVDQFSYGSISRVRQLLGSFLNYASKSDRPFDFRDCAVGNLIFAGAYLENENSFNAAAQEMSRLVNSQAVLVNVSKGEDRILTGLKADGELLVREADIVGKQSAARIIATFFLSELVSPDIWAEVADRPVQEKIVWLKNREAPTDLSPEAQRVLERADIIIYGPGTQHSSLFPSYRIAAQALLRASAPVKAFIVNLSEDNDIQGWKVNDLVDRALEYAGDPENQTPIITHILLNSSKRDISRALEFANSKISRDETYRGARVVTGNFSVGISPHVHNGYAVVSQILRILEAKGNSEHKPSLDVFVDLYKRAAAAPALVEEFLEINWPEQFTRVRLCVENILIENKTLPTEIRVETIRHGGQFPEVDEVLSWLNQRESEYLVTITGDGEYRFRDVQNGIAILRESVFGAIYGSRTQSRRQFNSSLRAAYGELRLLRWASSFGAFLLSVLFGLRFGVIFSDPLTGFRIYRREYVQCLKQLKPSDHLSPTSITKCLVANKVEIAELPVRYRTFVGFTNPWWRLKRGFMNLFGLAA